MVDRLAIYHQFADLHRLVSQRDDLNKAASQLTAISAARRVEVDVQLKELNEQISELTGALDALVGDQCGAIDAETPLDGFVRASACDATQESRPRSGGARGAGPDAARGEDGDETALFYRRLLAKEHADRTNPQDPPQNDADPESERASSAAAPPQPPQPQQPPQVFPMPALPSRKRPRPQCGDGGREGASSSSGDGDNHTSLGTMERLSPVGPFAKPFYCDSCALLIKSAPSRIE